MSAAPYYYGRTVEDAWALARRLYQRLASQEKYNIQSRRSLCELSDRYKAERDAAKVEVDSLIESLSFATAMTRQSCAAGKHPDWWLADEQPYKCPWCDCERFRAEIDDLKALARQYRASLPLNSFGPEGAACDFPNESEPLGGTQ